VLCQPKQLLALFAVQTSNKVHTQRRDLTALAYAAVNQQKLRFDLDWHGSSLR
jgi:hypothetical protein